MPIMAKSNDEYTEVKAIKTPNGTEIDYVLSKVDNTYKRTYTAIRELEDAPPLNFKSIKPNANLIDYRIYGQTSRNLFTTENKLENYYIESNGLILSTPNYNTTDFLQVDPNTAYSYSFINSYIEGDRLCPIAFYNKNKEFISCNLHRGEYPIGRVTVPFTTTSNTFYVRISYLTIIVDENMMLNSGSAPLPYEPYGESVGDRTANLFDENSLIGTSWYFDDEHYLVAVDQTSDNRPWGYNYSQLFITLQPGSYIFKMDGVAPNAPYAAIQIFGGVPFGKALTNISSFSTKISLSSITTLGFEIKLFEGKYRLSLTKGTTEPSEFEPYGYKVPVTISNGTDTLTTPIYLPEQIKKVGDEAEYIDYAEQKQHRVRKNLVSSYLAGNNLARYSTALWCEIDFKPNTEYILDFISGADVQFYTNEHVFGVVRYTDMLGGKKSLRIKTISTIDKNQTNQYHANKGWVILKINDVATEDIEISDVQIRLASIEDDTYEPYITDTELDVTLPALPTVTGTNVLSVGTEVQPSDMYIKGNFKMIAGGGE